MCMQDPFTWSRHVRRARRIRWQWRRKAPQAPVRMPYRRRLAAIERALMADAPVLASKFSVFNELTDGERPLGAERVPGPARPRLRPRQVALFLVLAVIAAACLTLSTQIHPVERGCPAAATAGTSASYTPVRGLACHAYPTAK